MTDLYEQLAPEWRAALKSGRVWGETDASYYRRNRARLDQLTALDIISATAHELNISRAELLSNRQEQRLARARFVAMHLVRETLPGLTLTQIGRAFKRADHSTIRHALNKARKLLESDAAFADAVRDVRAVL